MKIEGGQSKSVVLKNIIDNLSCKIFLSMRNILNFF